MTPSPSAVCELVARPYAIPQPGSNTIVEMLQAEDQSGQSPLAAGEAPAAAQRREALKELFARTQVCTRCAELASTRRKVVSVPVTPTRT